jgi:shikimate kinase
VNVDSIALIGYRGAGKTAVAQQLAARLGWDWIDADDVIELRAGKSIADIFADEGQDAFRDLEAEVVTELCSRQRVVIALGGGAVMREVNRQALQQCREVVWLKASPRTIEERLAGDPSTAARRPNLTNAPRRQEIERLLSERTPIYRACATLEVDTEGKAPAEIADEIAGAIGRG